MSQRWWPSVEFNRRYGCVIGPDDKIRFLRCMVCGLRYDTKLHVDCPSCLAEMRPDLMRKEE